MYEWNESMQRMIDWIEAHLTDNPSLLEMSGQIGYSPYYCSSRFHSIVGMTIKSYVAGRRLARAALDIRDTKMRILDIALKYGYSSQEALTRAFMDAYGCTPAAYRRKPVPIPLFPSKVVLFPEHYVGEGESIMEKNWQPKIRIEHIPAHKYIGIWDISVDNYGSFWGKHDCDTICGIIESMSHVAHPIVTGHTAGWFYEDGKKGYFYGFGVPDDYDGEIPEGFEVKSFPASYYMVFYHPPFEYLQDNVEVMKGVGNLAWNYKPESRGWSWNEDVCQDYQRHNPEEIGYEILRPVKKV